MKDDATPPIDPAKRVFKFRSYLQGRNERRRVADVRQRRRSRDRRQRGRRRRDHDPRRPARQRRRDDHAARVGLAPAPASARSRYKYADKRNVNGPITSVQIRGEQAQSRQGTGALLARRCRIRIGHVRVELGARHGFCATAPARAPATSNDTTAKFNGERNAPQHSVRRCLDDLGGATTRHHPSRARASKIRLNGSPSPSGSG